jgi:predicted nucleic acid-binding protein
VIAYFDTSAIVPLVVDEATTAVCNRLWTESTRVVSVRLTYPEARAALARAGRMGRLTRSQLNAAVLELDSLIEEVDVIELSPDLARTAGQLAHEHGLRGYDAVHFAAALAVADDDLVLVTGDLDLAAAAQAAGIAVSVVTA